MKITKIILSIITMLFAVLGLVKILPFDIANPIMLVSLVWRGAASAGLDSSADRAYMKAPVPRPTLQLVDKVSRSCGHTPGKVAGQRATVKAEMKGQSQILCKVHFRCE